jgi:hypothetical protein
MAKKLGRPRKKRKNTRRKPAYESLGEAMKNVKSGDTIFVNPPNNPQQAQAPQEPHRASVTSYVFIAGNRTLIRNLSDEFLNNQYESIITESNEMRRQLSLLESLQFNMSMEQRFRGLK